MHAMLAAVVLFAQEDQTTFCQNWDKGTGKAKVEFLLGPEEKLLMSLKKKGWDDNRVALFKVCFETNILKLRDRLDKDCQVEKALTKFFNGAQVDTSSQEYDHMTDYINMCAVPEGQET